MERVYKKNTIMMKILPCMMIAMFVVMCISAPFVHASEEIVDGFNVTVGENEFFLPKVPAGIKNYIISYYSPTSSEHRFYLIPIKDDDIDSFFMWDTNKDGSRYRPAITKNIKYTVTEFIYRNGSPNRADWAIGYSDISVNDTSWGFYSFGVNGGDFYPNGVPSYDRTSILLYSSFDLKDNKGNVVFQKTPLVEPPQEEIQGGQEQTQETILSTQITSVDFSQVIREVLQMLPIILAIVIGLLALRKAIRLLLQTLRKA